MHSMREAVTRHKWWGCIQPHAFPRSLFTSWRQFVQACCAFCVAVLHRMCCGWLASHNSSSSVCRTGPWVSAPVVVPPAFQGALLYSPSTSPCRQLPRQGVISSCTSCCCTYVPAAVLESALLTAQLNGCSCAPAVWRISISVHICILLDAYVHLANVLGRG